MAGMTESIGEIAGGALTATRKVLAAIDATAKKMGPALQNWQTSQKQIGELVDQLSWLMDGWETVIAIWDHAENEGMVDRHASVEEIMRALPKVPSSHLGAGSEKMIATHDRFTSKMVRAGCGWTSGAPDLDLKLRFEALKSTRAA